MEIKDPLRNKAVREGRWQLVKQHNQAWELYDLMNDPTELHDLAKQKADFVHSLKTHWNQWSQEQGVRDWPLK